MNAFIKNIDSQNHSGLFGKQINLKLNFKEHLDIRETKVHKEIGILSKTQPILQRFALIIYKSFLRPHLD